jgi:hypothetical protein
MQDEPEGPYIQVAALCEKVLQEKDGVLSVIRVVDRIISTAAGAAPPERMPPVPINLTALLSFKSGFVRGSYTMTLRTRTPSGRYMSPELAMPVLFEGDEDRGANLIVNVNLQADEEGLYWFDVLLGGRVLTRMPLRVVYRPIRMGTSGQLP